MSPKKEWLQVPDQGDRIREHLANERTLLAWVRTGVAMISIGIVVERAGAIMPGSADQTSSMVFGLGLVGLGCITLVMGGGQFFRSRHRIMHGEFMPALGVYITVMIGSLAFAAAFIFYVLLS